MYCFAVNTNDMDIAPSKEPKRWNALLLQFSNIASLLCVLDCTILPALMLLLPLLGMVSSAGTAASTAWLHTFSHQLTRCVVLPLGTLATSMHFTAHRRKWITALGGCGLALIALANSGSGCGHAHAPMAHSFRLLQAMQHGLVHRVVNLTGCALLMGSNFLSFRRSQKSHAGACCGDGSHGESTKPGSPGPA
jgi:MerC mercury resistance protein